MLSGFAFSDRNMPLVFSYFSVPEPAALLHRDLRGIFLKGVGVGVLWPQMRAWRCMGDRADAERAKVS